MDIHVHVILGTLEKIVVLVSFLKNKHKTVKSNHYIMDFDK